MEIKKYATIRYLLNKSRKRNWDELSMITLKVEVNEKILKLAKINDDGEIILDIGFSEEKINGELNIKEVVVGYRDITQIGGMKFLREIKDFVTIYREMNAEEAFNFEEERLEKLNKEKELVTQYIRTYNFNEPGIVDSETALMKIEDPIMRRIMGTTNKNDFIKVD